MKTKKVTPKQIEQLRKDFDEFISHSIQFTMSKEEDIIRVTKNLATCRQIDRLLDLFYIITTDFNFEYLEKDNKVLAVSL